MKFFGHLTFIQYLIRKINKISVKHVNHERKP